MSNFILSEESQKSALVKSFWAGIFLRELKFHGQSAQVLTDVGLCVERDSLSAVETDAEHALTVKNTSLSPSVHKLLTEDAEISQTDFTDVLDAHNGTLNWIFLARYIEGEGNSNSLIKCLPFQCLNYDNRLG